MYFGLSNINVPCCVYRNSSLYSLKKTQLTILLTYTLKPPKNSLPKIFELHRNMNYRTLSAKIKINCANFKQMNSTSQ